ncbi:hypothetical protein BOTBODRAFT_183944 [Botryobasidium botryosum FD-172 SS1]|uniref:Zn(2)-C6 fungal-type domain-containing protein n=1 Tax=Botryobasidium botryosum (strain FD-172 SS1) TaxID=930990 RepID=A0A067MZ02_BOTB1|nr:hypothetical protein BOTBODRAFT_183944 [Botryobasidium botryosum FD-172 SS1]
MPKATRRSRLPESDGSYHLPFAIVDMETAPARIVLPLGTACLTCRRRKRKCDGKRPVCGPCKTKKISNGCKFDRFGQSMEALQTRIDELQDDIRALEVSILPRCSSSRTSSTSVDASSSINKSISSPSYARRHSFRIANPGPLDIPTSLKDPFIGFLKQKDIPTNIRDPLVDIFLRNRWLSFVELNVARFQSSYKLPPNHSESIHPALLDAVCLLGCLYSRTRLQTYERFFYTRVQSSLYECLANADRLFDFIRASALVTTYCYLKGRRIEGHNRASAIARFAMACGLHRIDLYSPNQPSMISPSRLPRDLVDVGDMIYTWWGVFCADRVGAMALDVPGAIPDDEQIVTTPWPLEDYTHEEVLRIPYQGLSSFRLPDAELDSVPDAYRNLYVFRVQSFAMLYRATLLVSSFHRGRDVAAEAHLAINAASRLCKELESYRQRTYLTFNGTRYQGDSGHGVALVFAMTAAYSAWVRLLRTFSDQDIESHQRRLDIARECASLAIEMSQTSPGLCRVAIGLSWSTAYEVLTWDHAQFKLDTPNGDLYAALDVFETYARQYTKKYTPRSTSDKFSIHRVDLVEISGA